MVDIHDDCLLETFSVEVVTFVAGLLALLPKLKFNYVNLKKKNVIIL